MEIDHRPWGMYEVLADEPNCKVKRIIVDPGKRLSYQSHQFRQEHWYLIQGQAIVTLNDQDVSLVAGQAIDIPFLAKHRIANSGTEPLVFVEIQTGEYFGEDDIFRYEDDHGRV